MRTQHALLWLSVGSIFRRNVPNGDQFLDLPSPFTRLGPGYRGMIKPDLVDYGGGFDGEGVTTLNPDWIAEGNLFRIRPGTSLSAPRVCNHIAKIFNKNPSFSANLAEALLLASAEIPSELPKEFGERPLMDKEEIQMKIYNIYGFGKPELAEALFSTDNRVLLIREDVIKVNQVRLFSIFLPEEFITETGKRSISVTVVYNPPVNKNRASYLGVALDIHLFKNTTADIVRQSYGKTVGTGGEDIVPPNIRKFELHLRPGTNIRKKGVHQKATIEFSKRPQFDHSKPLILAVICRDKGWIDKAHEQNYGVVVTIQHSKEIDLYSELRLRNVARARIR